MTRRAFFTTVFAVTSTPPHVLAQEPRGLSVKGQLTEDTFDLQPGYFSICGMNTGTCQATDAIGISVHPKHALFLEPLQSMVGHNVQVMIVPV